MGKRHSNSVKVGAIIFACLLVGYRTLASLFDLEEGEQRSRAELQAIFAQNVQSFEKLVALCRDQPALRYVKRSTDYAGTYTDVARGELTKQEAEIRKILYFVDAVDAYCSWALDASPPRLYSMQIRYYFDSNRQGRFEQDIVYYAPENIPDADKLSYPEERVTLTQLPAEGWYIWEKGINHEGDAP